MATRGKRKQPERLSERDARNGVCNSPFSWEQNHESAAEMTAPCYTACNT